MTRIIDLTRQSMGWNNPWEQRPVSAIDSMGIHHSATATGSQMVFENSWRQRGWRNGGYSEIILRNGDVEICYVPEVVTNGVAGHNRRTYNICVVGSGSFTPEQERALEDRIRFNRSRFNIPIERVLGHHEFPNQATSCPGRNMTTLRNRLNQPSTANNHIVRAGETLNSIARQHGVTLTALINANPQITNPNLIRTGKVLTIPASGGSTTTAPTQRFFPATQAGIGIVDALNAINVNSSFANRQQIARANGINNYTGTASQNNQLLSLLRAGRLVRL
jgi:LysM domain/N-acetylmuramoyl-L-alanine amidase